MYTEYTILQQMHSDIEEQLVLDNFKYHHFKLAWYSFADLLDITYSAGFCCNNCGHNPNTLIMDGTSVSFRRVLDSWGSLISPIPSGNGKPGR